MVLSNESQLPNPLVCNIWSTLEIVPFNHVVLLGFYIEIFVMGTFDADDGRHAKAKQLNIREKTTV